MSIKCEFSLLKETHEMLAYCGEKIDQVTEQRYDEISKRFTSFIAANHASKPGLDHSVEEIRRRLQREDRDHVCKGSDYELARRVFFAYVSDSKMAAVNALLSRPRDPSEGECL
jgi:hypothetical protein